MSKKFWYLKDFDSHEEALSALKEKDLDHIAEFYIESCEDRTWIGDGGGEVMKQVLTWLIEAYQEDRLDMDQAKVIAQAIQSQYKTLKHTIPKDIDFVIEGQEVPVSSFMLSAQSPFFRDLIRRTATRKGRKKIEMPRIQMKFFDYIKEFVNTAFIEFLWREEPEYILNFIRQSQKLGMEAMTAFASEVYKRYLTKENVIPHLQMAQKEFLKDLENECCRFVNEQNFGLTIQYLEGEGLEVTLEHILDIGEVIFDHLRKQISFLVCKKSVAEDTRLAGMIRSIPRLVGMDLSETTGVSDELMENFPSLKQLNLSSCEWLDDEDCLAIIKQSPKLIKLTLSKDTNLTFRSWGELASLTNLIYLDLSYCDQMDEDDFDLMASSCPRLSELHLMFTPLNDKGLASIGRNCHGLSLLDLTDCSRLRGEGLIELGQHAKSLQTLNLTNCRKIDQEHLAQFRKVLRAVTIIGQD